MHACLGDTIAARVAGSCARDVQVPHIDNFYTYNFNDLLRKGRKMELAFGQGTSHCSYYRGIPKRTLCFRLSRHKTCGAAGTLSTKPKNASRVSKRYSLNDFVFEWNPTYSTYEES